MNIYNKTLLERINNALSEQQLIFLKLYAFNYPDNDIFEILGIDNIYGMQTKQYVKQTLGNYFKTDDWNIIIKNSFKIGLLDKNDYINTRIIEQANKYAEVIFKELYLDEVSFYEADEPLKNLLYNFINVCEFTTKGILNNKKEE